MKKISLARLLLLVCLVLFKVSLDASYFFILSTNFADVGYFLNFNISRYIFSWLVYILSFKLLVARFNYVKDYFFMTAVLGVITPLLVLWGMDYNRDSYPVFVTVIAVFLIYLSYNLFFNIKNVKMPFIRGGEVIAVVISIVLVVFLIVWYSVSGVKYSINFANVYEYRVMNSELSHFGILAYVNTWVFKVFAVFLLAYLLLKKNYILAFLMVFVFIYYYAANTHKSVFFTPFLILSFWFYFSKYKGMFIVPLSFTVLIVLSILSYYIFDDIWLSALFPNRVFEIPAHLSFQYFEFFKDNSFLYFSNSFLKNIIEYPYNMSLNYLIGDFDGKPYAAANNGYISSAYAQGGIVVVLLYSIIIGIILSMIDKMVYFSEIKAWFALLILMVPLRDLLISMDLLTTLLTGGLVWSLFLIYMVRNKPDLNLKKTNI